MAKRAARLSAEDVRKQVKRILGSDAFADTKTLGKRFDTLMEMVLRKRPAREFEWQQLEHQLFEEEVRPRKAGVNDSARAQNRVRQELFRIKRALEVFYQDEGAGDRVHIAIIEGSRKPTVTDRGNAAEPDSQRLAYEQATRLILKAKLWLDARTWRGDLRALECVDQALKVQGAEGTAMLGFAVVWLAVMPRFPGLVSARWNLWERADLLGAVKTARHRSWETLFIEACLAAREFRWSESLALMRKAADMSVGEIVGYWWFPALLASQDCLDEAVDLLDGMVGHYSRGNVGLRADLATLQIMAGAFGDAEDTLREIVDVVGPDDSVIATHLALLYEAQDKPQQAEASLVPALNRFLRMTAAPQAENAPAEVHPLLFAVWGLVCGRAGNAAGARAAWESCLAQRSAGESPTSAFQMALVALGVGNDEEAIAWLRRAAFDERDPMTMWFHIFPPLRHLRARPAFRKLLADVNLPCPV